MKFSEKLKALRKEHNLTQDELAQKLYVTRTAISKWETDKGFPAIDSLKLLSEQFGVSIDEMISDSDIDTQRKINERKATVLYWIAIGCFVACAAVSVAATLLQLRWLFYVGYALMLAYVVLAIYRTRYRRTTPGKVILPLVLSRVAIGAIIAIIMIFVVLGMG